MPSGGKSNRPSPRCQRRSRTSPDSNGASITVQRDSPKVSPMRSPSPSRPRRRAMPTCPIPPTSRLLPALNRASATFWSLITRSEGTRTMTNEIRVGLIGFGYAGKTFHAPLIRATEGLRLAAVASSDAAKVQADLGSDVVVTTPSALIASDDIDLIVIATPNDLHHPQALAALTAGGHVVIDKPFALNLAQARELVAFAQERGLVLSVFHNRRWDSDFMTLARILREERLGRIVEVVSHFDRYRPQVRGRWRE